MREDEGGMRGDEGRELEDLVGINSCKAGPGVVYSSSRSGEEGERDANTNQDTGSRPANRGQPAKRSSGYYGLPGLRVHPLACSDTGEH